MEDGGVNRLWAERLQKALKRPSETPEDVQEFVSNLADTALSVRGSLQAVNTFVNMQRYVRDEERWGRRDYWACLEEFWDKGGDCEDFAIAKADILLQLGWPPGFLSILIVYVKKVRGVHAVLVVDDKWILDNLFKEVAELDKVLPYYNVIAEVPVV